MSKKNEPQLVTHIIYGNHSWNLDDNRKVISCQFVQLMRYTVKLASSLSLLDWVDFENC